MNFENRQFTLENSEKVAQGQALGPDALEILREKLPEPDLLRGRKGAARGGRPKGSFSRREAPLMRKLFRRGPAILDACMKAAESGDTGALRLLPPHLLPADHTMLIRFNDKG
jgi:hypothetical protein